MSQILLRAFGALLVLTLGARGEWNQFRGPTLDGHAAAQPWNPAAAGKVLWQTELGLGISAVAVSGGRAFTMGNVDGQDIIYCFDAASGKEVWRYPYPMKPDPNLFEGGPRSTPVIDGDRLYAVSHEGDFFCLDAATGRKLWYHHYQQDFGGKRPGWGYAGSPLVHGNAVFCDVGGPGASTVALDKKSGAVLWKAGNDASGYATPTIGAFGGQEVLVLFKAEAVVGCAPETGQELWRTPWKTSYNINAATPLPLPGDRLFIGSGYNTGCALFKIGAGAPSEVWRNKNLRTQINTAVAVKDALYGIDGDVGGGHLVCVAVGDGHQLWEEKSVRGGTVIVSGGKLISFSERGELVIGEATPDGFHALARQQVMNKRCWAHPVLEGGLLYLRSNEGHLVCLDFRP